MKQWSNEAVATTAALLLAISPWHLQFSRAGFEANLALFFLMCGWLFFMYALRKNGRWLAVSVLFFSLSSATYVSARLFAPLILATFSLISINKLLKDKRNLAAALFVGFITVAPFIPSLLSGEAAIRAYSQSILGKEKIFPKIFENYLANFDTTFLFFRGDQNGRHSVRKLGMLYLFELPLILLGLKSLLQNRGKEKRMILSWLLLAPISVSLSNINPHAIRSLHLLPAWIIVSAMGMNEVIKFLRKIKKPAKKLILSGLVVLSVGFNVFLYLHQYYVHYPRQTALDWQDGVKEAVGAILREYDSVKRIYIPGSLPPVYLGFYLPVEPSEFQKLERPIKKIGKIEYFKKAWNIEHDFKSELIVAPFWQKPPEDKEHQKINMVNGDTIFYIWER